MRSATENRNRVGLWGALVVSGLLLLAFASSASAAAPKWRLDANSNTTVAPGEDLFHYVIAKNVGDAPTSGEIAWRVELPEGMTAKSAELINLGNLVFIPCGGGDDGSGPVAGASVIVCKSSTVVNPGPGPLKLMLETEVDPTATGTLMPSFEVSGGGGGTVTTVDPVEVTDQLPPFGIEAFDANAGADASGAPLTQAGAHPYDYTTHIDFNTIESPNPIESNMWPVEATKELTDELPAGLIGNPTVVDQCTAGQLAEMGGAQYDPASICPPASQVGTIYIRVRVSENNVAKANIGPLPVFNMVPPPGAPARFGFNVIGTLVNLDAKLRNDGEYGLSVEATVPQGIEVAGNTVTFWGVPSSPDHDVERDCPGAGIPSEGGPHCTSDAPEAPFFRLPTSCPGGEEGSMPTNLSIDSWQHPGVVVEDSTHAHEPLGYPYPRSQWGPMAPLQGCDEVPVKGTLKATPTARDTQTPTGLNVHVEVPNPGLGLADRIATSDVKKVRVALPQGMTVNPSQAEGLGACSPAQYESTELSFYPSDASGCPSDSKIGTVSVKTPLLEETIPGDVFIASPYDNPFGSLLALYVVLEEPQRGILVKLAGEVQTDPVTGQITASFDDLPQLPFDSFDFKFREGARAPLVTPQACGKYETVAQFTGHSDPDSSITSKSSFEIDRGIGAGPCPGAGLPPFRPGLQAGSVNPIAGAYSPFNIRLFRADSEQEMVNFSIKLPPGIAAKLAGVPFCPDSAIEASKSRSGAEELASPSCPAASQVGRTLVGAGVGSVQTYVPGKVYLTGPYNGSALSIAAITAAKVGPFDLGTVVVREALKVDPETAEVFVDPTGSDPIPHIIDGITTHIRDIRAYVDKSEFALNPTSCDPTSTASTVLGSGLDFSSSSDDRPVTVSTRYQVADCAALAFKPKLSFSLKGQTRRGGNPALRAVLKMAPHQANIQSAQVTLPRSEFLDQGHIGTVCTRVQYAADQCPARSIYGYARAFTPILDEPLQGPVYLRSSRHTLPDLVAGLKSGKIEIDLVGRIDSPDGRIRNTFEAVPDAPVSKFVLTMKGGKKGLLENSTNLCNTTSRATVAFDAHNGKISDYRPVVKAGCGKSGKAKRSR